jgi:hypothetical protein
MGDFGQAVTTFVVAWSTVGVAHAQPKAAAMSANPVGANPIMKLTTDVGFVDDVVAYDGSRIAYVLADTSTKAELHVVQLGCAKCAEQKKELVVDLTPVTMRPISMRIVGQRIFVVGATEDGNQIAALVELGQKTATSVYSVGPAAHITVITTDGQPRIAVHKIATTKTATRHDVELLALDTGKLVTAGKPFELDKDHHKKLDFRVNHWADGFTRAVGLKGGEWDKKSKKSNVQAPDVEAMYDLVAGKFVEQKPIGDLVEQRKRYQVLAESGGQLDFVRTSWDNKAIQVWFRGVARTIELDQPLAQYDITSLQGVVQPDGSALLSLKIDPVNADAVARKKADPEFLDVFRVAADNPKAVRKARIPAKNQRFKFGTIASPGTAGARSTPAGSAESIDKYFWLLERSTGFDRGGRNITVYSL